MLQYGLHPKSLIFTVLRYSTTTSLKVQNMFVIVCMLIGYHDVLETQQKDQLLTVNLSLHKESMSNTLA